MSHLPFTLLAYLFNAASVTLDKFLLTKSVGHPLSYIFYISLFSLLALLLLPLTHIPNFPAFLLGSVSALLWTLGAYFMFAALKTGQPSRVIPVIGTLTPIILLFDAVVSKTISSQQILAVIVLILGLVFLTALDWKGRFSKDELLLEFASSLFFAVSYLILRQAYLQEQFLTVFVWSKFIIIPMLLIMFFAPPLKKLITSSPASGPVFKLLSKMGVLFLIAQAAGGSSELLLMYSISLATPALVNSLQGSQYAFLFLINSVLSHKYPDVFKEKLTRLAIFTKLSGIGFIGVGLYLLAR